MNRTKLIIRFILVTSLAFALGLIIGHFAITKRLSSNDSGLLNYFKELIQDEKESMLWKNNSISQYW